MAQNVYSSINPATTSGNQLATILNDFKNAVMSGLKGPTRPPQTTAGGGWIDDSQEGSPTFIWTYKVYTGTVDVTAFTLNLATNTISYTGSDDTYTISRTSADAVGAIINLNKKRIANSGQVLTSDVVGEQRFISHGSDDSSPVVGAIKVIAAENATGTANGSYMAFFATTIGAAAQAEVMRLYNGNLGLGVTVPTFQLHMRGTTGSKSERLADDAVGVIQKFFKARVAGTGAGQLNDILYTGTYDSQDSASTAFSAAKIEVKATEAHTATNRGTQLAISTTKIGEAALTEQIVIGDKVDVKTTLGVEGLLLNAQSIATSASITALSATKALVNFTGSTDTELRSIASTSVTKVILLHNNSSAKVTLKHEYTTGTTAGDRLKLPKSRDIILLPDTSVELFLSTVDSRWKLKSGSGGGGGEIAVNTPQTVTGGAEITLSTDTRQLIKVAASGAVTTATLPFGNTLTPDSPLEIILIGDDDTNSVNIPLNDVDYGAIIVGGADSIDIMKSLPAKVLYYPALKRFYISRGV